jgi:ATP-dependent exoDNAse (exonuclease V) alpha subunit
LKPAKNTLQPLELSSAFRGTLDILEKTDTSAFITGKAGTGKSTLLQLFRSTTKKRAVVLAPTGIAALNVRGQTIHSFFAFPPKLLQRTDIERKKKRKQYKELEVLIIDEISMVRADIVDAIDYFLQVNRDNRAPFGGVQVLFFGDLFQLPPVIASEGERHYFSTIYPSPYFFDAAVIKQGFPLEMIELTKVYRQDEVRFIRLLDAIRTQSYGEEDIEELNTRHIPAFPHTDGYVTLCSVNALANSINQSRLNALASNATTYTASTTGEFTMKLFPTDQHLILKEGAQVVLLRNDPERKFVNGTIGKIVKLTPEMLTLQILNRDGNHEEIEVARFEWELIRYDYNRSEQTLTSNVIGTFRQFPIKLAWAITIHKSQGKTFDRVIIDLGYGAFESGQTYVALSRCRTLDGIVLKRKLRPDDVIVDPRILEYYDVQRRYLPSPRSWM